MNAFKTDYVNSRCCSHFPIHTVRTVSLAANSRRAGSQLVLHPFAVTQCHARCPPHVSVPLNRRFTGGTRSHGARRFAPHATRHLVRLSACGDVSKVMSDEIRQPRRAHDPSFCRLRVLALGYGVLRPSCRSKPGVVSYSTRLTAPDTLVASVVANGGYRPCAAHFSAGHGAALRSTLRA